MNAIEWNKIWPAFIGYFQVSPDWGMALVIVVSMLIFFWVSSAVISKWFIDPIKYNPNLRLKLSVYYSLLVCLTLLVTFSVIFTFYNSFIFIHKLESVILLLFISFVISIVYVLITLARKIKNKNHRDIGFNSGPAKQANILSVLMLAFQKKKLLILIVYVPFLLVFFTPSDRYLYSIIFDNSASMDEQNSNAQEAIGAIVNNLKENSHYIVTNIPICKTDEDCERFQLAVKTNINQIIAVGDTGNLTAVTNFFNNKSDFYNFINSGGIAITGASSPIYECIWDNFTKSVKYCNDNEFDKKSLIVLTDGLDNLYAKDLGFKAPNTCISDYKYKDTILREFYDNITFISYLEENQNGIFKTCSEFQLLDGQSLSELKDAFSGQLQDIYFDKELLLLLFILITIVFLIILIIK